LRKAVASNITRKEVEAELAGVTRKKNELAWELDFM